MCCIVNTLLHEYWSLKVGASERGQPPKRGQKGRPHSVLSSEVLLYILLPVRGGMCSEIRGIIFFSRLEGVCVLE